MSHEVQLILLMNSVIRQNLWVVVDFVRRHCSIWLFNERGYPHILIVRFLLLVSGTVFHLTSLLRQQFTFQNCLETFLFSRSFPQLVSLFAKCPCSASLSHFEYYNCSLLLLLLLLLLLVQLCRTKIRCSTGVSYWTETIHRVRRGRRLSVWEASSSSPVCGQYARPGEWSPVVCPGYRFITGWLFHRCQRMVCSQAPPTQRRKDRSDVVWYSRWSTQTTGW